MKYPIPVLTEDDQTLAIRMALELRNSHGFEEKSFFGDSALLAQYESVTLEPSEKRRRNMTIAIHAVKYANIPMTMDFVLQTRAFSDPELVKVLNDENALRQLMFERTKHMAASIEEG